MTQSPDLFSTPLYESYPLYAVIGGETVELESHATKGVMGAIHEAAAARNIDPADLPIPLEVFRSPVVAETGEVQ